MDAWWIAGLLGIATGLLMWRASRAPVLAWVALAPLGLALVGCTPTRAALAGALAGALGLVGNVSSPAFRALVPLTVGPSAATWGLGFGLAGWALEAIGSPWLVVVLPVASVLVLLPLRVLGAPRWVSNPLACTQERWLPVVHIARLGGDLATTAVLALASSALALVIAAPIAGVPALAGAGAAALLVVLALSFGVRSLRAAQRRVHRAPRVRVAAIVVDGAPPRGRELTGLWPIESPEYRDVAATVRRYEPHVARAVELGARLLVLPEVCVSVDAVTRDAWLEAIARWAKEHRVAIVAPSFDTSVPKNGLAIVDERGLVARYDKQHPARGLEPPRHARTPVGPHAVCTADAEVALSTVICVDLDYADHVPRVRAGGGILAAPSNDWFGGFELLHHSTAVWSAVMTGATIVRATGHGISSVIDGAGRVMTAQSSQEGPVVLVVDAPHAMPR
jgi:predicted amidohydrolase